MAKLVFDNIRVVQADSEFFSGKGYEIVSGSAELVYASEGGREVRVPLAIIAHNLVLRGDGYEPTR